MIVNHSKFIDWLADIPRRSRRALGPALISALAGLLAWPLSTYLLGHELPLFATLTAVVCLAPGLPNHGSQSVMVVLGVTIGVLLGELIMLSPLSSLYVTIPLATFIAMLVAASFGFKPVVSIQASISSVLILAFGPQIAGFNRLMDVLIGAGVALVFSQILFTPNPMRGLCKARDNFMERLQTALGHSVDGLNSLDAEKARLGTNVIVNAHQHLIVLDDAIDSALSESKWSIRGQLKLEHVENMAKHYDRRAIRLYAATVLLCESIGDGLRRFKQEQAPAPPTELIDNIEIIIKEIEQFKTRPLAEIRFSSLHFNELDHSSEQTNQHLWRRCQLRLLDVQNVLKRLSVP